MKNLMRDPLLDDLVKELNQSNGVAIDPSPARAAEDGQWPPSSVPTGDPLEALLIDVAQRGASDLHLLAGSPPILRVGGRLVRADAPALSGDEVQSILAAYTTGRMRERLEADGAVDFSLRLTQGAASDEMRAWRFRVNVHRQRGTLAAAVRALPTEIPTLAQLNLPPGLADLVKSNRGLVLVCGPTGSGKT